MAKRGTLTVRVVSDTKDGEKGLDRFASKAQTTGQRVEQAGKKMTVFATVPIAAAMGMAANAASDLNETLSKSNTVFGSSAKSVEKWADTASDSFGQSKREALDAASSFGNLFVQLGVGAEEAAGMSMEMTELASDFASFHNADITEVIEAQTAAFRGEYDALQRFVPTINAATVEQKALAMTGKTVTSELTAQEKALAVQTLMLEGAGDAMGDFDRTSGSAANQMRSAKAAMEDASAEIGTALLPLVANLAGGVADLAAGFGGLPKPVQNGVLAIAGLVAVTGPALTVAGRIATTWAAAGSAIETAGIGALYAKDKIGTLAKTVGGFALGVGAIFAVKEGLDALGLSARGLEVDVQAAARATSDELVAAFQKLDDFDSGAALEMFRTTADGSIGTARRLRDALNAVGEDTSELDAILRDVAAGERQAAEDGDAAADALGAVGDAGAEGADGLDEFAGATKEAIDPTQQLEDSIRAVTSAMRSQLDPIWAAQDAFAKHKELQDELKWANIDLVDSGADLATAIDTHGRKSDEAAAAWHRQLEAQQRVDELNGQVVRSAGDVAVAASELKARIDDGSVSLGAAEDQLRLWVEQGIITADQAWQTAEQLRGTAGAADALDGRNIRMTVGVDISQLIDGLRAASMYVAAFNQQHGTNIATYRGPGVQVEASRHSGGRVSADSMYLVGRAGHEELFVPDQSGSVISGPETDRLLGRTGAGTGMAGAGSPSIGHLEVHNHYPKPETGSQSISRTLRKAQYIVGV